MSRIGNRKILIPEGVEIKIKQQLIEVKGAKGTLSLTIANPSIKVSLENNLIKITRTSDKKEVKQLHGTYNSLLFNMIEGVTKGFSKELEVSGIGYKAAMKGENLELTLGFSHVINLKQPPGINIITPTSTSIVVSGIDKQLVGEIAAKIRSFRKPEPYKGKGIKYKGEQIIRKAGKTATTSK